MKTKVKATIERGSDGRYNIHTDYELNGYGLLGYGDSVQAAIDDFMAAYQEVKEMMKDGGENAPDLKFEYYYDMPSFLNYYNGILSKSGLEKVTGVNQKQLWHYAAGIRSPKPDTVRKIQEGLHKFASELEQVRFID